MEPRSQAGCNSKYVLGGVFALFVCAYLIVGKEGNSFRLIPRTNLVESFNGNNYFNNFNEPDVVVQNKKDSITSAPTEEPTKAPITADDDDQETSFTLNRVGYDPLTYFTSDSDSYMKYEILNGYDAVIEPYAPMAVYIMGDSDDSYAIYYKYDICKLGTDTCYKGIQYVDPNTESDYATVECDPFDEFEVKVAKYNGKEKIYSLIGSAICIYVRREIRSLTESDLNKTMDAMYQLWITSEEDGQRIYGGDFHNSTYFVEAHHFNAAWQDADHIHEGLGFLPQHVKITNMFEVAMQTVDPSITLPYWDFTIENEESISVFDSFVFQENTFGALTKPSNGEYWSYEEDSIEDGAIFNGRWKGILSDFNNKQYEIPSPFGYMRGPWNMNPSVYVSRFTSTVTSLPGCEAYYQWASMSQWDDFLAEAPYLPHASLHGILGGVYGCDLMDPLLEAGLIIDKSSQIMLCSKWGFYMKELYRNNYIIPMTDCNPLSNNPQCGFTCVAENYETMGKQIKKTLNSDYLDTTSEDNWDTWRDFICNGDGYKIFVGDHLESASPSDPSFWPLHPTLERFMHAKLLSGGFDKFSWPVDTSNDYVCDKGECYESEYGVKGYFDECCFGHFENDQLLDFVNGNKDNGMGPTNKQVLQDSDPTSKIYAMNYIYDDFKWSHCSENDFEALFEELYNESLSSKMTNKSTKYSNNNDNNEDNNSDNSDNNNNNSNNNNKGY